MTARYQLPVVQILSSATTAVWQLRVRLARGLAIPGVLLTLLVLVTAYTARVGSDDLVDLALSLPGYLVVTLFAVVCHRIVIPGERPVPRWGILWTMRETRFFCWTLAIGLLGIVVAGLVHLMLTFVPADIADLAAVLGLSSLPAAYLVARLSLVFPATAIDRRPTLGATWDLSRNNGWRLTGLVFVLPWVLSLAVGFLARILLPGLPWTLATVIRAIAMCVLLTLSISFLSLSYWELSVKRFDDAGCRPGGTASL